MKCLLFPEKEHQCFVGSVLLNKNKVNTQIVTLLKMTINPSPKGLGLFNIVIYYLSSVKFSSRGNEVEYISRSEEKFHKD